jgi:hypothetical protein
MPPLWRRWSATGMARVEPHAGRAYQLHQPPLFVVDHHAVKLAIFSVEYALTPSWRTADVVANDAVDEAIAPLPIPEVRPPKSTFLAESAPR